MGAVGFEPTKAEPSDLQCREQCQILMGKCEIDDFEGRFSGRSEIIRSALTNFMFLISESVGATPSTGYNPRTHGLTVR